MAVNRVNRAPVSHLGSKVMVSAVNSFVTYTAAKRLKDHKDFCLTWPGWHKAISVMSRIRRKAGLTGYWNYSYRRFRGYENELRHSRPQGYPVNIQFLPLWSTENATSTTHRENIHWMTNQKVILKMFALSPRQKRKDNARFGAVPRAVTILSVQSTACGSHWVWTAPATSGSVLWSSAKFGCWGDSLHPHWGWGTKSTAGNAELLVSLGLQSTWKRDAERETSNFKNVFTCWNHTNQRTGSYGDPQEFSLQLQALRWSSLSAALKPAKWTCQQLCTVAFLLLLS